MTSPLLVMKALRSKSQCQLSRLAEHAIVCDRLVSLKRFRVPFKSYSIFICMDLFPIVASNKAFDFM